MDVVIDVLQVPGHLGEDARLVGQSAAAVAPIAHDAHLHEATGSPTQQRTTVIPLKHKTRAFMRTRVPKTTLLGPPKNAPVFHIFPRYEDFMKQISTSN